MLFAIPSSPVSLAPAPPSDLGVPPDTSAATSRISVVIADPNPVFLHGLASVLQAESDFAVVASCRNGAECIAAIRALSPNLALLDMSQSEADGLEVLAAVRADASPTRVVLLSSTASAADAARAFSMGASGVIPKDGAPQSLVWWLRQVMSGEQLALLAVANVETRAPRGSRAPGLPPPAAVELTAREMQIVELVSTGLSNREVGERLQISEGTIKVHLHHIFRKLAIRNRTALATIGRERLEALRTPRR